MTVSDKELEWDIAPFRALSHAPIGMTGHLLFTAWDKENPATLSPFVIEEIIRKRIGFDGLLLTDDIDMQALEGTVPERSEKAIAAGCDVVLNCWAKIDDMEETVKRLPAMSAEATERLAAALDVADKAEEGGDKAELLAKRDSLLEITGLAA